MNAVSVRQSPADPHTQDRSSGLHRPARRPGHVTGIVDQLNQAHFARVSAELYDARLPGALEEDFRILAIFFRSIGNSDASLDKGDHRAVRPGRGPTVGHSAAL